MKIRRRLTRQIRTVLRKKTFLNKKDLNQAEDILPDRVLRLLQTCNRRINTAGKQKRKYR